MKQYALYYAGKLVGIVTNPENYGTIWDVCNRLSPDEGLATAIPLDAPVNVDSVPTTCEVEDEEY